MLTADPFGLLIMRSIANRTIVLSSLLAWTFGRRYSRETNRCARFSYAKRRSTSETVRCSFASSLCSIALLARSIPDRPAGAGRTQRYATLPMRAVTELSLLYSLRSHTGVADERAFGPTMRGAGAVCDSAEIFGVKTRTDAETTQSYDSRAHL